MKLSYLFNILLITFVLSCKNDNPKTIHEKDVETTSETNQVFQNKGHELVYNMVQKVGNYSQLSKKKDVIYTYTYQTPDGKTDISTEKYMFDGELSYGAYNKHERTLAELNGLIEQGYDGKEFWLKHEGKIVNEKAYLEKVAFNRPTNFYWFTMFQKLLDPNLNYEFIEETSIDGKNYNVVKITFQTDTDAPTDIYQLYINKDTSLVDQFLFTVADFGKMEIPFLMTLQYESVDGLLIPTKRQYKASTWNADVSDDPWVNVNWSDIKFNNNLTKASFKKD
ncbi:hypothetical protein [Winogradskyella bathintestinalis]|uniref:Uncharacterized protein n=1 Tax=Winogradskyella bathintestinalis TaxID=3035208 RepID=A0ABT7ZW09_9FLAO|nr:hypothetical protein [Winogradskyella bathintestinalis]MDN3493185.1 hypothetical protein [Winogradskyella bathintestinalis]